MLIDLHAHTFPRSDDSFLSPEELFQRWSAQYGLLILPGCEVNTEEGHLLVFGLSRYVFGMHRAAFVRRLVEEAGGAMVLAHAYRRVFNSPAQQDPRAYAELVKRTASEAVFSLVDAMEAVNGRGTPAENGFTLDVARFFGKPAVACSDAHKASDVGLCATRFFRQVRNVGELIDELRAGRCEPVSLAMPHPRPMVDLSRETR